MVNGLHFTLHSLIHTRMVVSYTVVTFALEQTDKSEAATGPSDQGRLDALEQRPLSSQTPPTISRVFNQPYHIIYIFTGNFEKYGSYDVAQVYGVLN